MTRRLASRQSHGMLTCTAHRLPSDVNSPSFLRSFIFSSCTSFSAVTLSASTFASCAAAANPRVRPRLKLRLKTATSTGLLLNLPRFACSQIMSGDAQVQRTTLVLTSHAIPQPSTG